MRLLIWILGVECTLAALMDAYTWRPGWAWAWWVFLGLWMFAGLVVLVVATVGAVTRRPGAAGPGLVPLRPAPKVQAKGEE